MLKVVEKLSVSHGGGRCDLSVACPMYRLSMFRRCLPADSF